MRYNAEKHRMGAQHRVGAHKVSKLPFERDTRRIIVKQVLHIATRRCLLETRCAPDRAQNHHLQPRSSGRVGHPRWLRSHSSPLPRRDTAAPPHACASATIAMQLSAYHASSRGCH